MAAEASWRRPTCRAGRGRGPAPGAGLRRRALVRRPARGDGRGHRHQRQDLGRQLHPPDLDRAGPSRRSTSAPPASRAPGPRRWRHTTPEPITLHRALAEAAAAGVTHAAMEASSPRAGPAAAGRGAAGGGGLHQLHPGPPGLSRQLRGLFRRQGGAVRARAARGRHRGDQPRRPARAPTWPRSPRRAGRRCSASAAREGCDLRILGQRFDATGQELRFDWNGRPHQARLDLIGGFQAENVLVAAGLAIAGGRDRRGGLRRAAAPDHGARPDAACRDPRRTARRCSSITPIRPTRWRPR